MDTTFKNVSLEYGVGFQNREHLIGSLILKTHHCRFLQNNIAHSYAVFHILSYFIASFFTIILT